MPNPPNLNSQMFLSLLLSNFIIVNCWFNNLDSTVNIPLYPKNNTKLINAKGKESIGQNEQTIINIICENKEEKEIKSAWSSLISNGDSAKNTTEVRW